MEVSVCIVAVLVVSNAVAADSSDYDALVSRLLFGYNPMVPPMLQGTNVSHSLNLKRVIGLDNQILTLKTLPLQSWPDPRLTWQPADHGDIDTITLPASAIWLPDITLYNDADVYSSPREVKVTVASSGHVTWVPMVISRSWCNYKIKPSKKNRKVTCKLTYGSWTQSAGQLDVYSDSGNLDLTGFSPSQTWKLIESSANRLVNKFPCCPQEYSTVEYVIKLKALS